MTKYSTSSDLQLINFLKEDDEKAFGEIYNRYAESLAGFASSKLYDLEESKDLIHDVFVKLWQERTQLQIDRDLKAWLFKSIRFRIIDKIRKNITRQQYAAMADSLDDRFEASIEQQLAAKELTRSVEKALDELTPRLKEIYLLSRNEDLSIQQIADKLQLSPQTVKNQLSTALKHLRKSLGVISIAAFIWWLQ